MASEITRIMVVVTIMGVAIVGMVTVAQNQADNAKAGDLSGSEIVNETTTTNGTAANETSVCVVFFHRPGCPHCAAVEEYLTEASEIRNITVRKHNAIESNDLLYQYHKAYDVSRADRRSVPIVFVGDEYRVGDRPAIEYINHVLSSGETVACPTIGESTG